MAQLRKLPLAYKAFTQLGFMNVFHYLVYKIGVHSGFFRIITPSKQGFNHRIAKKIKPNIFWKVPDVNALPTRFSGLVGSYAKEADRICNGRINLFGTVESGINLTPPPPLHHWAFYEKHPFKSDDIKLVWEPARFSFSITLGQAFVATQDARYFQAFIDSFNLFQKENPINRGPNWQSGQEIALRLISWVIAAHYFQKPGLINEDSLAKINNAIADHAARIPITISYAKAQGNNHLISEAVCLYTAGVYLHDHPSSNRWRKLGKKWFFQAIRQQIDGSGEYCQHSTNYHRMMLMLCLWMNLVVESGGESFEEDIKERIAKSVYWLQNQMDPESGNVINLGHNDGSFVIPFDSSVYSDYRPVLQAASRAFCEGSFFESGPWDMLSFWLNLPVVSNRDKEIGTFQKYATRIEQEDSWAKLRAVKYTNRPAHADQLMVNIWHGGIPLTLDAGTYQYNAAPPWENSLAGTNAHSTITIGNQDQMTRAGKFLWLNWADAEILQVNESSIIARHNGYDRLNIVHKRELRSEKPNEWLITDWILPKSNSDPKRTIQLHWLLPEYEYLFNHNKIQLSTPNGNYSLDISVHRSDNPGSVSIIRAGETVAGNHKDIHLGWFSPTYTVKVPALSVILQIESKLPVRLLSRFVINGE